MPTDGPPDSPSTPRPDAAATGLLWRPLAAVDVSAWHALVTAVEDADEASERQSEDDLRELLLEGPAKDPAALSLVGVDPDGGFRAFGVVDPDAEPAGEVRVQLFGGVDPTWRRRGIGARVLEWQVAAARAHLARARHGLPARVGVDVEDGSPGRTALLERAGFTPLRWFRSLHRPLDDVSAGRVEVPALEGGLRIAAWTSDLDDLVREAHNEVFRDHWGSQPRTSEAWRRQVSEHRDTRRAWSFVALDESGDPSGNSGRSGDQGLQGHSSQQEVPVVAGYTISAAYPHEWPVLGASEGYTALLGVRRPWRRRGVAPALLMTSLLAFAADGMQGAGLDVDADNPSGAADLYERLGYRTRRTSVLHVQHLPPD